MNLGLAFVQKGDVVNAIKTFETISKIENSADINMKIGNLYEQIGSLVKAIHYYKDASKLQPNDKKIEKYINRAVLQQKKNRSKISNE